MVPGTRYKTFCVEKKREPCYLAIAVYLNAVPFSVRGRVVIPEGRIDATSVRSKIPLLLSKLVINFSCVKPQLDPCTTK